MLIVWPRGVVERNIDKTAELLSTLPISTELEISPYSDHTETSGKKTFRSHKNAKIHSMGTYVTCRFPETTQ